jgi:hypothetical protein
LGGLAPGRPDGADAAGAGDARTVLSRTTLMTLRRVLHAFREGWLLEERLAAAARMAAEDARRRGLAAARLRAALEAEWASLDAVREVPARDAHALLGRLVAHAVAAYDDADAPADARLAAGRRDRPDPADVRSAA